MRACGGRGRGRSGRSDVVAWSRARRWRGSGRLAWSVVMAGACTSAVPWKGSPRPACRGGAAARSAWPHVPGAGRERDSLWCRPSALPRGWVRGDWWRFLRCPGTVPAAVTAVSQAAAGSSPVGCPVSEPTRARWAPRRRPPSRGPARSQRGDQAGEYPGAHENAGADGDEHQWHEPPAGAFQRGDGLLVGGEEPRQRTPGGHER